MKRRHFLGVVGTGLVAGCGSTSSGSGGDTPNPQTATATETPTATPTASPTPTPEPTATPTPTPVVQPTIDTVSLLSNWESFGDTIENQVSAVGRGATAVIGFRYRAWVSDGTADYTEQVRIFDESGTRIDMKSNTGSQLVDSDGYQQWGYALFFDTRGWDLGEYEAEVIVKDNSLGKVSNPVTTKFRVNRPLESSEVNLVSVDDPESVRVGESYTATLTFENTSDRDGSLVSPLSTKWVSNDQWNTAQGAIAVTIPAGGTETWESATTSFNFEGRIEFRVDVTGESWLVDVTG